MKILRQLWNQKGLDAAVEDVPEDRYGFGNIAENISRSILTLPLEASNVVGIEGAWGSGKTSLLNLILRNLALKKDAHTHVLHISAFILVNTYNWKELPLLAHHVRLTAL
uniref:P-loop NTPase fold protein n=1 Tax=Salmonella enterica TaxID=28901 RepID=UPI001F20D780|nr:P-loop NTPase fold protein [Salmonella enterica]